MAIPALGLTLLLVLAGCGGSGSEAPAVAAHSTVEPDDDVLLWTRGGKLRIKRAD